MLLIFLLIVMIIHTLKLFWVIMSKIGEVFQSLVLVDSRIIL